jgi:hypothetical protein
VTVKNGMVKKEILDHPAETPRMGP